MFPFVFTQEVKTVNEALTKDKCWEYKTFDVSESTQNYNEYIYFYEYVRKSLFSKKSMDEVQTSYYFEHKEQKGKYVLEVHDKEYTLSIDGISMRTFDTQVGILSLELLNHEYDNPEDILVINDFSRRLYPQFLGGKDNLEYVTNTLLPQSVTLHLDTEIKEDFSYYKKMSNIKKDATNLPKFIHTLLGDGFSSHSLSKKIHIEPIIDDRMFVISMYINDTLAEKMRAYDEAKEVYAYENDEYWYRYTFVDTQSKMCQSKHMTKKLIKDTTCDRWVEWGTLFGISRYSFVALTTISFGNSILKPHMHTMYFQIFTLLLAYRASMLNFSKRVVDLKLEELTAPDLNSSVAELYKDYIEFENNLFFREVTAQEQGIEIYNQALKVMQIEKHIKDLDSEIAELHNYVSMKNEDAQVKNAEKREENLATIAEIGAIFLPPTLLSGMYGMNIFDFSMSYIALLIGFISLILSALIGYAAIKKKISLLLATGLMIATIVGAVCLIGQKNDSTACSIQPNLTKKEIKDVTKPAR